MPKGFKTMAKLHYVTIMSLDGYIGDGHFDWSIPTEGSTGFITEVMRPFRTYLYGRKNYETMSFWESPDVQTMGSDDQEFGRVWRSAEKIIFSKTIDSVTAKNTRIERDFDERKIREMKDVSPADLCVGGPTLAAHAIRAGLVDEVHLFVTPTTISGAFPVIPVFPKDLPIKLDLIEERRFSKGWVYLRYRVNHC
jgi:dihydrofolate reductase